MNIVSRPYELFADDVYVDVGDILGNPIIVKCEAFNFAGSVKLKAARSMVDAAEESGDLRPGSVIVESSSGNLGVALAAVAASRGYGFVCVMDPRSTAQNRRQIEALGGRVLMVSEPDDNDGFLHSRIALVRQLCDDDPRFAWLNQYANEHNWRAHYRLTAPEIVRQVPDVDVIFVGAGTTGTLMGCGRYLRDTGHPAEVVAVDSVGSVTFGGSSAPRFIPGLGTSRRPEIVDESVVDDVVLINERETIRMCRKLSASGYLFGGSTGTVLAGATHWLATKGAAKSRAVAISPDLGERYLDTIYDDMWVAEHFGVEFANSLAAGFRDRSDSPTAVPVAQFAEGAR